VIGNAVHIMRVLTGDEVEIIEDDGKDPAARVTRPARLRSSKTQENTFGGVGNVDLASFARRRFLG
jgi:hypothetical protein